MERLDDLEAFVAIVDHGSQAAAARHLGRTLQSINRSLLAVEQGVGVPLIRRTTRQSVPTEAGLGFYERVKPALAAIREARLAASAERAEVAGRLRIGAPLLFASAYVAPACCLFMERNPEIEVELIASDQQAHLIDDGLDLAIRIRELPDSSLKVRRLGELRVVAFAAPSYLARHGPLRHPDDLAGHQCVVRVTDGAPERWPFRIDGERRLVRVGGRFRTNSTAATITAVERGIGLGFAPLWQIRSLVDDGAVEVVLEDFEAARLPIHAVTPPTAAPRKIRLFVDLLAARLKRERI